MEEHDWELEAGIVNSWLDEQRRAGLRVEAMPDGGWKVTKPAEADARWAPLMEGF